MSKQCGVRISHTDRVMRLSAMRIGGVATVLLVAGHSAAAQTAGTPAGDAVRGKSVFARCAACHAVTPGQKRMGPNLAGIVGRDAASDPGFKYSPAMRASGLVWTWENLDRYLKAPSAVVRGTSMVVPGIRNDADRSDLIAFLAALPSGN